MAETDPPVRSLRDATAPTEQAVSAQATGSGQTREPKDNRAMHMPAFFWWLCLIEFAVTALLGLSVVASLIYLTFWVAIEWHPEVHARIQQLMYEMNASWKVALIIFVPLFFRPIAKFLIYLKKVSGVESDPGLQGQGSSTEDPYGGER